ncbi:membrane protein [Streptomyces sp. MMG1533]|uniref:Rv1733c family protein n=1 Tax=Streptomyces sp. MMG1533 TaxID=1415546 RepID=UPI0006AFD85E|nr:hypothetical protein [Streptomyces sp. MMG1533]KOU58111.1 membrane protein [Streptomyces sp. MMG1533]
MSGGKRAKKPLWRWRSNPLRRRDDMIEAWIVLVVWAIIVVGGTFAGFLAAHAAEGVFARQRADRHSVRAVLLDDVPQSGSAARASVGRAMAKVRWTASDGSTRTGTTLVDTDLKAGSRIVVWQNDRGEFVAEPPSPTEAALEASLLGIAAALALAGTAFGAGTLARWRLDQRRIDGWGKEWDLVGPQWGHKTG